MTTTALSRTDLASKERKAHVARAKRGKTIRRVVLGASAVALAAAVGLAFRPRPLEVDTAPTVRGDLVVTVDEMAKTRVRDRYLVSAPLAGNLMRVELRAGDAVKSGAVLARVVPMQPMLLDARSRLEAQARAAGTAAGQRQAQAAIARAEIAETHARDELARSKSLFESGSIPSEQLVRAELEARLRVEELASARFAEQMAANEALMARAAVRRFDVPSGATTDAFDVASPVRGRVLRVVTQSAGPVQPGAPLVELGDPDALEIVADVLSADAVRMTPGAKVRVERWGGEPLAAHVRTVEPAAFTRLSALGVEEQRVPVVIDLDDPHERWAALGDGFRVEVRVTVAEKRGALQVPLASVFRQGQGWAVYSARDGRARLVPVVLGVRSDVAVEVTSGLAEGERVLVHPGERVAEGLRITSRE
jgi:HlyD family secretion protein